MAEMNRSEAVGTLFGALAVAQLKFDPVLKDTKNPYYNSKYADLSNVITATQEPLAQNGLVVIQLPLRREQDAGVITILGHTSGEWISSELLLPAVMAGKDGKPRFDSQSVGSAITYARRYAYQGIIGVAAEDDDGNAASGFNTQKNQPLTSTIKTKPVAIPAPKAIPASSQSEQASSQGSLDMPAIASEAPETNDPAPAESILVPKAKLAPTAETSAKPTPAQLSEYLLKAKTLTQTLKEAGLEPSGDQTIGAKVLNYFLKVTGAKNKNDLTIAQWETTFAVLDSLLKQGGGKAVEAVESNLK